MNDIFEYKIIVDEDIKIQTMLNQWRHDYDLHIIQFIPLDSVLSKILLMRVKKKLPLCNQV